MINEERAQPHQTAVSISSHERIFARSSFVCMQVPFEQIRQIWCQILVIPPVRLDSTEVILQNAVNGPLTKYATMTVMKTVIVKRVLQCSSKYPFSYRDVK